MSAGKRKQMRVLVGIITLIVILISGVVIAGVMSGWFDDGKVMLDAENYNRDEAGIVDLSIEQYQNMTNAAKSFMLFVDQGGCTTAEQLKGFITDYATETGLKVYRMMFEDIKRTSLHDFVKYYPSVVLVNRGKPAVWLRADEDVDADAYNDPSAFRQWLEQHLST